MTRVLGIDPGTGSMDLLLLEDEDNKVLYEEAIPRPMVTENPRIILDRVKTLNNKYNLDAIAAPSGYGIPHNLERNILDYIMEATFIHEDDLKVNIQIQGLRRVMLELYNSGLNVYFTPGVIHLPTVPKHRKTNRIDMGTADKIFTVAAALYDAVEVRGEELSNASFIVVEAGKAYIASIAVESGTIVDGIGGTLGDHGFLGAGAFDAEVAYTLASLEGRFSRKRLFEGGAGFLAGELDIESFTAKTAKGDENSKLALELLAESVARNVFRLLPSFNTKPRALYVSGRLFRQKLVSDYIIEKIAGKFKLYGLDMEIRRVPRFGKLTKEGATGAALLASGYIGGKYGWIVESLRLRESKGSIFDHLIIGDLADRARSYFINVGRDTL